MTDAAPPSDAKPADAAPQGPQGPGFRIVAQYVKDLSFENPKAPDSLRVDGKPAIDMGVEMNAQGRPDGLFEVDLRNDRRLGDSSEFVALDEGSLFLGRRHQVVVR